MRNFVLSPVILLVALAALGCDRSSDATSVKAIQLESTRDTFFALVLDGETSMEEVLDSDAYTKTDLAGIYKVSPVPNDASLRHYDVRHTQHQDGFTFTIFCSYLDEEDGGNTYGWVEDVTGTPIAKIEDGYFVSIEAGDGSSATSLENLPRAINPVAVSDAAAMNAVVFALVEEQEGMPVNPDGDETTHLAIESSEGFGACSVSADGSLASCSVAYLQDRWNGTLTATFKVVKGQAVELLTATVHGNF